jgi:hypothetical protein
VTAAKMPWEHVEKAKRLLGGRFLDPKHLRLRIQDGEPVIYGCCPGCGEWAQLDRDQLHGIVSTHHEPGCGWHRVKNWWAEHLKDRQP